MEIPLPVPRDRILGFIRYLRYRGYIIGVGESSDVFHGISALPHLQPGFSRSAIRALCCRNHDEWQQFEEHFIKYWYPHRVPKAPHGILAKLDSRQRHNTHATLVGFSGASSRSPESDDEEENFEGSGAGRQRTLGKADFRFLGDAGAMREAGKLAELLGLQLRKSLSRRRKITTRGGQLDLRRTLRRSIATGGFPGQLKFNTRKVTPLDLVILHDVSHSMAWNNPLLFRFVRGLVQTFSHAVAYGFHTHLFPMTQFLRQNSLDRMRAMLERQNRLWMGGTCIAQSILAFNQQYKSKCLTSRSIVLIISDGIDTDDKSLLDQQLTELKSGSKKILWLNPMLGRPGVSLNIDTLQKSLPMIDRFLPANSVDGLRAAIKEIGKPGFQ